MPLLRQTLRDWIRHRCVSKGAALAFYALFSLAPVLVLVIALAGMVFGADAASGEILRQLEALMGAEGASTVQKLVASADDPATGTLASLVALAMLVIGSTTAFAELKNSLDEIWFGHAVPDSGIWGAIRDRLLSFGLVLVLAFLLLISLTVNATLALLAKYWLVFAGQSAIGAALSSLIGFVVITALFAAIYKLLPPARLSWGDVAIGAGITALLFQAGKYLIGLYLGNAPVTSTLGAAGSVGVLALWVYYSAQIFFVGAEFTRLYAQRHGSLAAKNMPGTRIAAHETTYPDHATRSPSP